MKKVFIILFSLFTGFCAQSYAQDGPQFKFDGGDTWDYGVIPRGPIASHEFTFVNVGNQPLNIVNVTPSCGCTGVDWIKTPVLPGQKGWIKLGLKTIEQHGVFDKEVYIQSNAVKVPHGDKRYTIYIKGDAKGDDPK
jgi:hypothetical protein